jgi:Protein of unknown function (DUF1592)/Protein of unknown function (DUF1588)/Protein of unknown function (DUF1585)/Protein of unknown function (DUF1587)/Protein of unknown function (DUF1595)/Planctomycete cytochrome C
MKTGAEKFNHENTTPLGNRMRILLRWGVLAPLWFLGLAAAETRSDEAPVKAFFGKYCVECHGPEKQKGDRRFDQLVLPVAKADTLIELQDAIDQLNLGEMPPEKARQHPDASEVRAVIAQLTRTVTEGRARFASTGGQTVLRRLNRREYINTVGDLFGMNMTMFDPTAKFPRDNLIKHQDNIGDALQTSGYLLEQYMDAADQVVEKAFNQTERPQEQTWHFAGDFRQPEFLPVHAVLHNYRCMVLYETTTAIKPEGSYGYLPAFSRGVPADGYYNIRVKAEAKFRHSRYGEFYKLDLAMPFRLGVVAGSQKAGLLHAPQLIEPELGEVPLKDDQPEWYTFRVWLDRGFTPRFTFPNGLSTSRGTWGPMFRAFGDTFPEEARSAVGFIAVQTAVLRHGEVPQIRIHEVEIRGPLDVAWPPAPQRAVLGDRPFSPETWWSVTAAENMQRAVLGATPFPPERMREILETFATRAYRRPVRGEEVDQLLKVVAARRKQSRDALSALKEGLKAALCAPAFLYLVEPESGVAQASGVPSENRAGGTPALLPAHALASRLSYFLWSTMPDAELRKLADSDDLVKPEVLLAQVRRLLASPRAQTFVDSFLDGWLNLRSLGEMAPDRMAFTHFYTDKLQSAMKQETRLFTQDLLERNESVVRFLDADYTFVNRPLARHYGMDDAVEPANGHEFRRVKLRTPLRGGLLGQASVLTVSANGIETSPVVRGVWVLENIFGTPPAPPPDNVPPIDPDVRGATSMRDLLAKHRDNPTCYECHRKIDPPGFALEVFDPIGAVRTTYEKGIAIDTSGELPGGQKFADVAGLKKVLVGRKDQFARMLTERLLGYACGRRIEALDRPAVDAILAATKPGDFRFRDLLEQVVLSPTFRSK